jgi:hypothetical protein
MEEPMRRLIHLAPLVCAVTLLVACAGTDSGAAADSADTVGVGMQTPTDATPRTLASVAGRWNVSAVPESGDTTPTTLVLNATADTTGWTITFPNREPVPTSIIAVAGDSIVTQSGPYESARRPGVQVTTTSVWRLMGDHLMGTAVARYAVPGADSVLRLRTLGTRIP